MLICCKDVWSASASFRGSLCVAEVGFDEWTNFIHETGTEDASQGGWKLQRTFPIGGVGPFVLLDPDTKVHVNPEDKGLIPIVCVN